MVFFSVIVRSVVLEVVAYKVTHTVGSKIGSPVGSILVAESSFSHYEFEIGID